MTAQDLIARLRAVHRLDTEEEVEAFQSAVNALIDGPRDPALLGDLLLSFYDDTDDHELMWRLLQLVEDYPAEANVQALSRATQAMSGQAAEWVEKLHSRAILSDAHYRFYKPALALLTPAQRASVVQLLEQTARKRPQIAARIAWILGPADARDPG